MTLCVLDASVALAWSFKDEVSLYASSVIASITSRGAVAPVILPLEINNALVSAVRRGRIDEILARRILGALDRLPMEFDSDLAVSSRGLRVLRLGIDQGLSSYDASYLELAIRRALPLATVDARLARAATAMGVPILEG